MSVQPFVPRRFQAEAVDNATAALHYCLTQVERLDGSDQSARRLIAAQQGTLLFEAPTGTGKTYMAAATVDALSRKHKVLWFWFAPFQGVVGQAENLLHADFSGLRPRSLADDREPGTLRTGDVFVTTWASVATASQTSRRARQQSETQPSIDQLVVLARSAGFHIGVVIDEAHHTFRNKTQAHAFYRDVLDPDVTILATATPRDADIDSLIGQPQTRHLHRIAISRAQGVEADLLKRGVKVAVFKPPANVEDLVDFERIALTFGVQAHRQIKRDLANAGLDVNPLLLVQVGSSKDSTDRVKGILADLGFGESQVRVHTADEPDPFLLAIAADETVEVLVFKMAVALGFDAPRAFTLVSMRTSRDADFGVQVVGRIMRVDRRLQLREVPGTAQFGYVFLADHDSQAGMLTAAERINAIKSEMSPVTETVTVIPMDGRPQPVHVSPGGAVDIFPEPMTKPEESGEQNETPGGKDTAANTGGQQPAGQDVLGGLFGLPSGQSSSEAVQQPGKQQSPQTVGKRIYLLRSDLHVPQPLQSVRVMEIDRDLLSQDIVARVRFDDAALTVSRQRTIAVLKESREIFEGSVDMPESVLAEMTQDQVDRRAQLTLFGADPGDMVDARALHRALIESLRQEFARRGWSDMLDPVSLQVALHRILALRPSVLRLAVLEALALHVEVYDAGPLPAQIESDHPLRTARLNIYGIYPRDMNKWEIAFAEFLEGDLTGTVQWWHRNPPRKSYSVGVPLPGGANFYPDFVVGIDGRQRGHGILLAETKRITNEESNDPQAKAQARHPLYGKIMMVFWQEQQQWVIVEYDEESDRNILDRVLQSTNIMKTY